MEKDKTLHIFRDLLIIRKTVEILDPLQKEFLDPRERNVTFVDPSIFVTEGQRHNSIPGCKSLTERGSTFYWKTVFLYSSNKREIWYGING